jgi:phosphate transport system permease protein
LAKKRFVDVIYATTSGTFGSISLIFLLVTIAVLLYAAYPSILSNGLGFFTKTVWDPRTNGKVVTVNGIQRIAGSSFGILVFVVDTIASSAIAVILAVPAGIGTAIFLTQIAPRRIAAPISLMVEMLAGIPSVIYGFWGFLILGPFLLNTLEPFLTRHLSFIPIFSSPGGAPTSYGLLGAGIILSIMIIPIIASISRDMMTRTPKELKDGAKALGLTRWEVTRKVVLPFAKTAIVGSVILGLGRALGETMAIAMLLGAGNQQLPVNLYSPVSTIASFMLLELPHNALIDPSGMDVAALMELGIILVSLTVAVNVVARLLIKRGFVGSSENVVRV